MMLLQIARVFRKLMVSAAAVFSCAAFKGQLGSSICAVPCGHALGQCCLRLLQAGGLPSGVLMIGDGLSSADGRWIFDRVKSPEPENMLQRLYAVDNGFS